MKITHVILCPVLPAVLMLASAASPALAGDSGHVGRSETVGGVTIYLGVTPAEIIQGEYSKGSEEREMHGGIPSERQTDHVMVALFDAKSGRRITDAEVKATVREVGLSGRTKKLLPMTIAGAKTYGNFFRMAKNTIYRIEVSVRRPGTLGPATAEFDYKQTIRLTP